MTSATLLAHFDRVSETPDALSSLRELVLRLAVRGRLVEQERCDEPASRFLMKRQLGRLPGDVPWALPSGWAWSSLSLIGDTIGGGTPSKSVPEFWTGEIPWVSPKDMKADRIVDAQDHITESAVENSTAKLIQPGSLLMVVRGMILAHSFPTALNLVPVTINQDMKSVVPFRQELGEYLLLASKGLKREILRLVLRSTHGTCKLLTEDLFSLPVPIPPLAEQRRILEKAQELMTLCDRLEAAQVERERRRERLAAASLRRLNQPTSDPSAFRAHTHFHLQHLPQLLTRPEQISRLLQTIMNLAVLGHLVPEDKNDGTVSALGKTGLFPSDDGVGSSEEMFSLTVPAHWDVQPLATIAEAVVDCPHSTPKWTTSGKICVRTNQFRPGHLDLRDVRYVSEETYLERIDRLEPAEDDVLYSREGGILGVACRVPPNTKLCLGQRMMLIRGGARIVPAFLEMVLNSPLITEIARRKTTGGAAPRVNVSTVKTYPIPIPPLAEQRRIVARVEELTALCGRLASQVATSQSESRRLLEAVLHRALAAAS